MFTSEDPKGALNQDYWSTLKDRGICEEDQLGCYNDPPL